MYFSFVTIASNVEYNWFDSDFDKMLILPWMGKFLDLQSLIRLLVLPWILSKFESMNWCLLSISIPSSVKEFFHLRGISGHSMSSVLKLEPKGTTLDLSRFA